MKLTDVPKGRNGTALSTTPLIRTADLASHERSARIDDLVARVAWHQAQLGLQAEKLAGQEAVIEAHEKRLNLIADRLSDTHAMTFWQRVRWLVLGG